MGQATVLVFTRDERESKRLAQELGDTVGPWQVCLRCLHGSDGDVSADAEDAIGEVGPGLILFLGTALAVGDGAPGDVAVADRVSTLQRLNAGGVARRRRTRRAHRELTQAACGSSCGIPAPAGTAVRTGLVATGSEVLELLAGGEEQGIDYFERAIGIDLSGWDFVFGYYDDVDLPAIAIWGLCSGEELAAGADEGARLQACDRAAACAASVLRALPPASVSPASLDATADAAEFEHARADTETLTHESTQPFLQRPFVDSAFGVTARAGRVSSPRKDNRAARRGDEFRKDGPPPDLILSIEFDRERKVLEFKIYSPKLGYEFMPVGETPLGESPVQYRDSIKKRINDITKVPEDADEDELANLGNKIYNDLFPPELKAQYEDFRDKITSLQITTDEPYIPWELVRPHHPDFPDDDFLCMRFAMTRWLRASRTKRVFDITALASVEAGDVADAAYLARARDECGHIAALAERRAVSNLSPAEASYGAVKELLLHSAKEIQLWHVAAHGQLGHADPDESEIILSDYRWRARDLAGRLGHGIQKARPLVFFNACLVGQQDFKLGQLGGWPAAWVVDNHCGGFIAPQWSVSSNLAAVFSKAFYDAVIGDAENGIKAETLGEATRTARWAVRRTNPRDPAWLSYVVYGHPRAEVRFGSREAVAAS